MESVLDGFYTELNVMEFPKEAPLLVESQCTRAKQHRVFIKDKQQNGREITNEVKKVFRGEYTWIREIKNIKSTVLY